MTSLFSRSRHLLAAGAFFISVSLPTGVLAAGPSISEVSPANATSNVPVTLTATVSSGSGIQSCNLYVDLEDQGAMTISGSTASKDYTFTSGGSRIAFVFCRDNSGGLNSGPNTSIWVSGAITSSPSFSPSPSPSPSPAQTPAAATSTPQAVMPGNLIKLVCAAGATADDVCHAVYYYGTDGKRHGFPNSKVFFTWYADFNAVTEVSADTMSGIPLGKNVTYRPGVRMVKFTTDPKVYAVAHGGVLRWVTTEGVASMLYGADWNTKIDDIADVFYTNYTFGADINGSGEYVPSDEMSRAVTIANNQ